MCLVDEGSLSVVGCPPWDEKVHGTWLHRVGWTVHLLCVIEAVVGLKVARTLLIYTVHEAWPPAKCPCTELPCPTTKTSP